MGLVCGEDTKVILIIGCLFQLVANLVVTDSQVQSLSQIAKLKDESRGNEMVAETLPNSETTFALMGNLFVSEGKPGKVFHDRSYSSSTYIYFNPSLTNIRGLSSK